ncbi:unnamed protein product [Angiostrongylus costaricensis]|uniref:Secreted protein n=1 Tax=Angiostrongylus costaricensis TaxID=334426 RepID=A0A0R3Q0J9_ANGCS|nr:unnamed protein product [Angiostrongylus costaricensis]
MNLFWVAIRDVDDNEVRRCLVAFVDSIIVPTKWRSCFMSIACSEIDCAEKNVTDSSGGSYFESGCFLIMLLAGSMSTAKHGLRDIFFTNCYQQK